MIINPGRASVLSAARKGCSTCRDLTVPVEFAKRKQKKRVTKKRRRSRPVGRSYIAMSTRLAINFVSEIGPRTTDRPARARAGKGRREPGGYGNSFLFDSWCVLYGTHRGGLFSLFVYGRRIHARN
ncbi:hypothetical protein GWI33_020335 [Rhynchophorus ferrugineus]|uniref:Uncharacterized protein n=1 Tax=Rhynchophorus ferrugineus TaxID=354439 RepID=A0A834I3I7_RHYFE|nr:hypothetical protein GWI33_020335 [Rhynchophorus ferrugineus]